MAFLFGVESFANSSFLAKGNELGVLGAYTIAFGLSFANLLPPFLGFGPVFRNFVHRKAWRRWFAFICATFYAVYAFVLNLGVAHYREVSGQLVGEAGVEVLRRITEATLGLQDAQSWLLFLIGGIFSLVAVADGWKLDDAYPGYGGLDRLERRARKAHGDAAQDAIEDLAEIREEALDAIKRIAQDAERKPRERLRIVKDCERWIEEFDGYAGRLERDGATLIDEYREANHKARSDRGVPRCHAAPWRLARPTVDNSLSGAGADSADGERIQDIQVHNQRATNRIYEHCDAVQTRLVEAAVPPSAPEGRAAFASAASVQGTRPGLRGD